METGYALNFASNLTEQKLVMAGKYVQKELLIRLAKSIEVFHHLPYIVTVNPHMAGVLLTYLETFEALRTFKEINNYEDCKNYVQYVVRASTLHSDMFSELSTGIAEAKQLPDAVEVSHSELDKFMSKFVQERLARRVLISHQAALMTQYLQPKPDHCGIFGLRSRPAEIVESATEIVSAICRKRFNVSPEVEITGDTDIEFCYIPDHLEYMLVELLKNSMRHTVKWSINNNIDPQPIQVRLSHGKGIYLRISDKGGGFRGNALQHCWEWGGIHKSSLSSLQSPMDFPMPKRRSTIAEVAEALEKRKVKISDSLKLQDNSKDPELLKEWIRREHKDDMGSLTTNHHGLPVARTYCRFLCGDIDMESLEGIGSHAYVTLADVSNKGIAF
eukprot:TRINITY_DN737_c2_g1_i2.p1 TRINITY_DN737_c2_g1~~TRINITY_DN737_c2_g1_i2.p1  ORF type:complete len:444 (+),score=39.31 TRINITY_DN737_c2_g1_i2:171-1334(+)